MTLGSPRVADYLRHMLEGVERIGAYCAPIRDAAALEASPMVQDAVIRNLEIIGEAANKIAKVDPTFVERHPEIEWAGIRGMRNKVIHDYFQIDFDLVWRAIKVDLPKLRDQVARCLEEMGDG